MLKDFTLSLELEPTENRVVQTAAIFWSHDVNTAKIYIELLRKGTPIILNKNVTVRVMMLFDDENKSEHIYTAKIEDELRGLVSITLEESMRAYVGQVTCGVYVDYQNEEKTDNGYFTFGMRRSLIDKDMPELQKLYVSDFEKALRDIKEFKVDIDENIRIMNDNFDSSYKTNEEKINNLNQKVDEIKQKIEDDKIVTEEDLSIVKKSIPLNNTALNFKTSDVKALIKKGDNRYDVITQKGNKYIEMELRKDIIDSSNVSLGGEGQVFRLTGVKEVSETIVYIQPKFTSSSKDGVDDFFVGKLDTGYNYPAKANYITNTGRENWNSYLKFKHKIKTTDNGKLGLAFYSTKNTNQELSVYVNDVKVDTIDTSTGEAGSPVVIYTVNVGKEIGNVEIKLQVPNSAAASKSVHFLGIGVKEFNTLEPNSEYNGILYNYSGNNYITKSKGANDYALKNAEGKWMGSYHGGEVIENRLITVDSKKETLAKDEVAFGSDISFYQKTNIDNTIKNNFIINISKPATIEHQNNFKVAKPFITKDFYAAMTCTNPEFNTVVSPNFFKTKTGETVFVDNVGEVIQMDVEHGLSILSKHSILKDYVTNPLYIQSSEYYNKVYHSVTTNKDYEVKDIYFSSSKTFN